MDTMDREKEGLPEGGEEKVKSRDATIFLRSKPIKPIRTFPIWIWTDEEAKLYLILRGLVGKLEKDTFEAIKKHLKEGKGKAPKGSTALIKKFDDMYRLLIS